MHAVADREGAVGALELVVAGGPVTLGDVALVGDGGPVAAARRRLARVGAQAPAVAAAEGEQTLAVRAVALAVAGAPVREGEHPPGDVLVAVVEVEHVPVVHRGHRAGERGGVDELVPVGCPPVAGVAEAGPPAGGVVGEQRPAVQGAAARVGPADQRPGGEVGVVAREEVGEGVQPGLFPGVGGAASARAELADPHRGGEVLPGLGDEQCLVVHDPGELVGGEVLVAGVAGRPRAAGRTGVGRSGVGVEVRGVHQLAGVDQGVGEVADRGEHRAAVAERRGGDAVPVDALHDDEQVRGGLQDPVSGLLEGGVLVVGVAQAPVGVVPGVAADLVAQVGADHPLVGPVPVGHEDPVVLPLRGRLAAVPALVSVQAAAEAVAGGVVVEDDREAVGGERRHHGVEHLERGAAPQLRVGGDGGVRDRGGVVDHRVGEGQPDAVEAQVVEVGQELRHRHPVQAERDVVRHLPGLVVRGVVGVAAAFPRSLGPGPVGGLQLEAVAVRVHDVAPAGAERAGPGRGKPFAGGLARRDGGTCRRGGALRRGRAGAGRQDGEHGQARGQGEQTRSESLHGHPRGGDGVSTIRRGPTLRGDRGCREGHGEGPVGATGPGLTTVRTSTTLPLIE